MVGAWQAGTHHEHPVTLSPRGEFDRFLELPHLRVFVAHPRYLLAMKCAAMRLGEEFHDVDDVRYLLRHLGIATVDEALAVVRLYVLRRSAAAAKDASRARGAARRGVRLRSRLAPA